MPAPGVLQHGLMSTAGGSGGSTLLQAAAREVAGHAGRSATQLNVWYIGLPSVERGNEGGSTALEGTCGVTGREQSAVPGGGRHGWHVAGVALEPRVMEGQEGCERVAMVMP